MKEKKCMPIVGLVDYGLLGVLHEFGGKPYMCTPYLPLERMTPENNTYLCMQGDELSPLEIFGILMWNLEHAVVGGYITNVEDAINFLKTNGVSMRHGELNLTFNMGKDQDGNYRLYSHDDRDITMSHFENLETMAEAFYNVLLKMKDEFGEYFNVVLEFRGEEDKRFGEWLEFMHSPEKFNLAVLNL